MTTIQNTGSFDRATLLLQNKKSVFEFVVSEFPSFFFTERKNRNAEEEISNVWKQKRNTGIDMDCYFIAFPTELDCKIENILLLMTIFF